MNILLKKLRKFFILCLACIFYVSNAHGERGDSEQLDPAFVPSQNFPGYFDTNVTPERRFMFSLPLGELSFGVTKNFSVNLNLPIIFYMIDTWNPGFLLSMRYRFFSNQNLSSALTGYAGYFKYKNSDDKFKIYYLNATYNNMISINKKNLINTQINGLKINYHSWEDNAQNTDKKTLNLILFAIGHTYIITKKWDISNLISVPLVFDFYQETNRSNSKISFNHIKNYPVFYRIVLDWNVTKNSLITFGGFMVFQSDLPFIILPWLTWSVLF
jgi:hypothetical protein